MVYQDAHGSGDMLRECVTHDDSTSPEQAALVQADLVRKATIWFSVSDELRVNHLLEMCEKKYSSVAVFKKLFDNVAPTGTEYKPLPPLGPVQMETSQDFANANNVM